MSTLFSIGKLPAKSYVHCIYSKLLSSDNIFMPAGRGWVSKFTQGKLYREKNGILSDHEEV